MNYAEVFEGLTELTGDNVILRPVCLEAADELFEATQESREQLYRFMPWENKTVDDAKAFIERSLRQQKESSEFNLVVREKESKRLAGGIGLHHLDRFTPRGEVGYWIRSSMYRQGYAGDARQYLPDCDNISFCFLDAEKETYMNCYEMVIDNMVSGGILVADNAISHRQTLQPMLDRVLSDTRLDALIVPIGKGELLCRKL